MQTKSRAAARLRFLPLAHGNRIRYIQFLRGAVDCLPPRQRQAAKLCLLEGYTLRQAAQRLGISTSAVSRRLRAAKEQLREWAALFQRLEEERDA